MTDRGERPPVLSVVLACQAGRHGAGGRVASWLAELRPGALHVDDVGVPPETPAVVLVVPAYARPAELARLVAPLRGARAAVVAYGGVDRGASVIPDAIAALDEAGAVVIAFAMALNAALVRVGRFSEFDVISARLLLDHLEACPALGDHDGRC